MKWDGKMFAIVSLVVLVAVLGVTAWTAYQGVPQTDPVSWMLIDLDGNGTPDILVSGRVILNPDPSVVAQRVSAPFQATPPSRP